MPKILWEPVDVGAACDPPRHPATAKGWAKRGELMPVAVTPRGRMLFDPSDVKKFLQRQRDQGAECSGPDR